jgi:cytochrome c oxidase subunit 2
MRTPIFSLGAVLLLFAGAGGWVGTSAASADEQVIRLTAKKFEYDLREITLKKGAPVVLELTSLDRVHGFNQPDFGVRGDAVPGMVTRVRFTPTKTGEFVFFCDVFCGDGHEEMSGTLIVKD